MFAAPPSQDGVCRVNQDGDLWLPDSAAAVGDGQVSRVLSKEAGQTLWREYISTSVDRPMALPPEAWPVRILSSPIFAEWRGIWRQDPGRSVDVWLQEALPWAGTTPVLFTWSVLQTVETTWEVFCLGWRHFLTEAEDAILWSRQEPLALRFLPSGIVYLGGRSCLESGDFSSD